MGIPSPNEMVDLLTGSDMPAVEALIVKIIATIKRTWQGGASTVNYTIPNGITDRVVRLVIERFRIAGWQVETHDDQREGESYLSISAPQERTEGYRDI